jgi:hypothetical protein
MTKLNQTNRAIRFAVPKPNGSIPTETSLSPTGSRNAVTCASFSKKARTYTVKVRIKRTGDGENRFGLRVEGQELDGRRRTPALTRGVWSNWRWTWQEAKHSVSVELLGGRSVCSKPVEPNVIVRQPEGGTVRRFMALCPWRWGSASTGVASRKGVDRRAAKSPHVPRARSCG